MKPEAYEHDGISVQWSCRYNRSTAPCHHEDCIEWERAEMVRLRAENERQSATMRRLRSENQWLRNRRNRAVELLTGDPGDDSLFISAYDDTSDTERGFLGDG